MIDGQNVTCDRCLLFIPDTVISPDMTGGFYQVSGSEYDRGQEAQVCDACMFKDPRYISVYGNHI